MLRPVLCHLNTAIQIVVAGRKGSPELQKTTESKVSFISVETSVEGLIRQLGFFLFRIDCVDLGAG